MQIEGFVGQIGHRAVLHFQRLAGNMTMCRDGVGIRRVQLAVCRTILRGASRQVRRCAQERLEAVREVPHAGAKEAGIAGATSSSIIHTVRSGKRPAAWHGLIKLSP